MAGKSPVTADAEQRSALVALSHSRDRGEADRARAILLTLSGWTSAQIAQAFGVREDTVRFWRGAFMTGGLEALEKSIAPGPAPVKAERALVVAEEVLSCPVADRSNWTLPRLAAAIERRSGSRIRAPRLSAVLDWARRELIVHTSRTKRSSDFIALLEEIDRRYGPKLGVAIQPLVLVLDNGPIHTSKATRAALAVRAHWLTVEWLPKYAPELNDIEGVWRDLKRHHLAHQTFTGPDDLDRAIHEAVIKLDAERNRHLLANHRTAA